MLQHSCRVMLKIVNIRHVNYRYYTGVGESLIHAEELGSNEVLIINCRFVLQSEAFQFSFASTNNGSLQFINCHFVKRNNRYYTATAMEQYLYHDYFTIRDSPLILLSDNITAEFNNCDFHGNNIDQILQTYGKTVNPINVVVRNTNYTATILTDD